MKASFIRKAVAFDQLKECVIEKTIELEPATYKEFSNDLMKKQSFIEENINLMYVDDNKVWHCILVKAKDGNDGILVQAEGSSYARYAAYCTVC